MYNNKITKLYQAFLSLKNLKPGNDTFELFMSACKDYNFLCTLEKIGLSYYVQVYDIVDFDGIYDYDWRDIARFDTEEEAEEYIERYCKGE